MNADFSLHSHSAGQVRVGLRVMPFAICASNSTYFHFPFPCCLMHAISSVRGAPRTAMGNGVSVPKCSMLVFYYDHIIESNRAVVVKNMNKRRGTRTRMSVEQSKVI